MDQSIGKRRHPRRQLGRVIRVDRWIPVAGGGAHEVLDVEGFDISSGGIGILATHELHIGEVVKVDYTLNDGITLPIYSEVIWCELNEGRSRIGMRFLM